MMGVLLRTRLRFVGCRCCVAVGRTGERLDLAATP